MSERQLDLNGPWKKCLRYSGDSNWDKGSVYRLRHTSGKRSDPGSVLSWQWTRRTETDGERFRIRDRNRDRRGRQKSGPPVFTFRRNWYDRGCLSERRENRLRRQHEPCLGVRYYRSCCRWCSRYRISGKSDSAFPDQIHCGRRYKMPGWRILRCNAGIPAYP